MTVIVQKEHPILRETTRGIPVAEISSPRIAKIIHTMKEALHSQADGVAIAAPQIGERVRIFVVSKRIFGMEEKIKLSVPSAGKQSKKHENNEKDDLVFVNPEIERSSRKKMWMEEGCLSVRWLYGKVKRAEKVTVRARNEKGEVISRGASGILAQVFQHEIDHLNGILFTDKAKEVHEMVPKSERI